MHMLDVQTRTAGPQTRATVAAIATAEVFLTPTIVTETATEMVVRRGTANVIAKGNVSVSAVLLTRRLGTRAKCHIQGQSQI